ncbi:hypothetical protein ACJX0J_009854, partial [Zea mays]
NLGKLIRDMTVSVRLEFMLVILSLMLLNALLCLSFEHEVIHVLHDGVIMLLYLGPLFEFDCSNQHYVYNIFGELFIHDDGMFLQGNFRGNLCPLLFLVSYAVFFFLFEVPILPVQVVFLFLFWDDTLHH